MVSLLLHIYLLTWLPPVVVALIVWLAVAIPTARVVGPLLRRNTTHYPTVEEARDGR